uniref:solute carrier family 35 member G1-like n=1 Tax=Styela clava TaxID=7725 RepID=UPI00193A21DA|nr:solute carrier family 35 member G1-like [Styela clava]XP_039264156.1 solute carrier family 35 member G1-like [Styela clava]
MSLSSIVTGIENSANDSQKVMIDSNVVSQKKKRGCKRWGLMSIPGIGILFSLCSAFFFSINSTVVKSLDLHPVQLSLSRCSVQFLILLPIVQYKHKEVDIMGPEGLKLILWARGFVGSTAMIFLYYAIDELSVGNAVTITYISVILVPFMARFLLKESLTIFDLIFGVITLIGVIFIAQPTFLFPLPEGEKPQSALGVLFGTMSATCMSLSVIIIRKLGRQTYPPLNVMYYSFCGSITTTIVLVAVGKFQYPCLSDTPRIFSLGVVGVLAQFFLTLALQTERAGTVGVLRSFQIILIYILQVTVLGDIPSYLSLIGAALIFSSSIGIGIRKVINEGKRRRSVVKSRLIDSN